MKRQPAPPLVSYGNGLSKATNKLKDCVREKESVCSFLYRETRLRVAVQNSEGFEHKKRHEKFVYKSLVSSGNEGG